MRKTEYSTLGLNFFITEPATPDEFDKLAGKVGACVEDANSNVNYRSTFPGVRAALCEELEALTGEPRKTRDKKNAKGEVVTDKDGKPVQTPAETEKAYYNRLLAGNYEVADRAPLEESEAQAVLTKLQQDRPELFVMDPTPAERSKKAPKEIESAADSLLARVEAGETTGDKIFSNIAAELGCEPSAFGEFSRDSLVAALVAIKEKEDRERSDRFA